jgi:hypothetical protein
MSERLFRFLLTELDIVRIRCMNGGCSGVIEMSVQSLQRPRKPLACPVCGLVFSAPHAQSLEELGRALEAVKAASHLDKYEVQFVVPDPDAPKAPKAP